MLAPENIPGLAAASYRCNFAPVILIKKPLTMSPINGHSLGQTANNLSTLLVTIVQLVAAQVALVINPHYN